MKQAATAQRTALRVNRRFTLRSANLFRRLQSARARIVRTAARSCSSLAFGGDNPSSAYNPSIPRSIRSGSRSSEFFFNSDWIRPIRKSRILCFSIIHAPPTSGFYAPGAGRVKGIPLPPPPATGRRRRERPFLNPPRYRGLKPPMGAISILTGFSKSCIETLNRLVIPGQGRLFFDAACSPAILRRLNSC